MKKNSSKKTSLFLLLVMFVVLTVALTSCLTSCSFGFEFNIGGENIELLNRLNANWQLDEAFEIENIQQDDLHMFWLHEKAENPQKAILQLHGGAYIRDLSYRENLYERMAEQYAKISGAGVLTVDYRIAPENPFPAALEDAISAYNVLLEMGFNSEDIVVAGDSAGGGLTLALVLYLRDNELPLPAAVVTMSAWTDLNYRRKPAYVGDNDAKDPYISPAYGSFEGFPPMLLQVGTKDIVSDTTTVAQKAREAGVDVTQTTYSDMPHVFQALFPELSKANDAWDEVENFLNEIFWR